MDKNQLDGLIAFKLVAEKGNFRAAADALNVTPSAVSQLIKNLEERLNVTLLNRTTRSTSLTEKGKSFLDKAGPSLDVVLTAMSELEDSNENPAGILKLNMPRAIYYSYLSAKIDAFTKKYPAISVEVSLEEAQKDVVKEGFDAGIRLSDILAQDMVAVKLFGPVKFVVSASPKYLNKVGRPKQPKDLLNHNCIISRLGSSLYDFWEFENKGNEFSVQVKGNLILNDSFAILNAALNGAGMIYSSENLISDSVKSGKLEIVLGQYKCSSSGFYLYYPSRSQVSTKLRLFIDFLKTKEL